MVEGLPHGQVSSQFGPAARASLSTQHPVEPLRSVREKLTEADQALLAAQQALSSAIAELDKLPGATAVVLAAMARGSVQDAIRCVDNCRSELPELEARCGR